jgi:hypothetical protein
MEERIGFYNLTALKKNKQPIHKCIDSDPHPEVRDEVWALAMRYEKEGYLVYFTHTESVTVVLMSPEKEG